VQRRVERAQACLCAGRNGEAPLSARSSLALKPDGGIRRRRGDAPGMAVAGGGDRAVAGLGVVVESVDGTIDVAPGQGKCMHASIIETLV
jgi:hypothetical protein